MKRYVISGVAGIVGLLFLLSGGLASAADNPPLNAGKAPKPVVPQSTRLQAAAPPLSQSPISPTVADDIRDIRGPLHMPDPFLWLYYAGGACLVFMAGTAVWAWFRRRKAFKAKLAYENAFEQLEQAKALITPEKAGEFSVAVSNIVRTYIEIRFDVRITRRTTEEFMAQIAAKPSGDFGPYADLLHHFLWHCDLAKFARYMLAVEQMREMHQSAWQFVDKTRPRPEEKNVDQASGICEEGPAAAEKPEGVSLLGALGTKGRRFIPKKTMMPAGLDHRSAVAAGGR